MCVCVCVCVYKQSKLASYSSFHEFNSNVVQFGYLGIFSGAFPAAPLLAWLCNINEVRVDAAKLVRYCQRPPLQHVKGVRVWVEAMKAIAYGGMIVNILILGLSSFSLRKQLGHTQPLNTFSYFPHLDPRGKGSVGHLFANVSSAAEQGSLSEEEGGQGKEEWGKLGTLTDRGLDFRGRIKMFWFMICMEHALFLVKIIISLVISDRPDWVEQAQRGIMQYRSKKRLEEAFAMNEDEEDGLEIGVLPVNLAGTIRAAVGQGDVSKVFLEMQMPPRERKAVQEKIMSLQTILMGQSRVDEKGLPINLDDVLNKEQLRAAAQDAAKSRFAKQLASAALVSDLGAGNGGQEDEFVSASHDPPLAALTVQVVEAIRPHSFDSSTAADEHFLYLSMSIHNDSRPGTSARTSMCEARPNLSFSPVTISIYHYPAEMRVELLSWKGAKFSPKRLAVGSVFLTAGPFDIDSVALKTLRLDKPQDDWFKMDTAEDFDGGVSPKGAIHLLLSSAWIDKHDHRLERARGLNAQAHAAHHHHAALPSRASRKDGTQKSLAPSPVRPASLWEAQDDDSTSRGGSSPATLVDSEEEVETEDEGELVARRTGRKGTRQIEAATAKEVASLGSIGVTLCLAPAATNTGAASAKLEKGVEQQARGTGVCQSVVQSVLDDSPAHAAGIAKVASSAPHLLHCEGGRCTRSGAHTDSISS
jgi:hypothetical protein